MSDSYIDDNIVKMTFDNKQFEQNAKASLNTIEKLKSSMNFEASVKGLDKVESAVKDTNDGLRTLNSTIDKLGKRFTGLGLMGQRALENITDSIYRTSTRMLKALTIDPVKQGIQEYELKMQSVQTIMASTGASVKEVDQYLDELNTYSDKTIYSFKDMTSNIGKFTNAGVSLKDAVAAIQGISNVAAVAGANTNEASRAMYNFSQALSAGYVKLIDWKSIELANMATKEFKENLISVAEGLGTVKKVAGGYQTVTTDLNGKVSDVFNATKNFNDSLSHQWMTNQVLNKTLAIYSTDLTDITEKELNEYKVKTKNNKLTREEALVLKKKEFEADLKHIGLTDKKIKQMEALSKKAFRSATEVKTWSQLFDTLKEAAGSGWAKTYEYLIGDKDESTKMLTRVNNVVSGIIDKSAELRNNILYDWHQFKGYDALVGKNGIFANLKKSVESVITPIHNAWYTAFPIAENLGKKLADITKSIRDFTKTFRLSEKDSKNLEKTFTGLFMILKTGKDIVTDLTRIIGRAIGSTSQKAKPLLSMVLEFTSKLSYVGQEIEYLYRVFKTVIVYTNEYFKITSRIADGVIFVLSSIASVAGVAFGMAAAGIVAAVNVVYKAARKVYKFLEPYISRISKELEKHQDVIDKITAKVRSLWKVVTNAIASPDELLRKINAGLIAGANIAKKSIMATIGTIRKVASGASGFFKPFTSTIGAELKKHGDILDAFVDKIHKIPSAIVKIPSSIGDMFKKFVNGLNVTADAAERGTNRITNADNSSLQVAVINDKKRAKSGKNLAKNLIANNAKVIKDRISGMNKIKKLQTDAAKGIISVAKGTANSIHNLSENVATGVRKFISNIKIDGIRYAIVKLFSDIFSKFGQLLSNIRSGIAKADIPGLLKGGLDKVGGLLSGIGDWFGRFFKTISNNHQVLDRAKKLIGNIAKTLSSFKDGLLSRIANGIGLLGDKAKEGAVFGHRLADALGRIGAAIGKVCKEITPGQIALALFVGAILYVTLAVGKLLFSLSILTDNISLKVVPAFATLVGNLSTTVAAFRNYFFPVVNTTKLKFSEFAQSIAILSLSLAGMYKIMSTISTKKLWEISAVFVSMMAALTGMYGICVILTKVMTKMPGGLSIVAFTGSILALSGAMLAVAGAFKIIESIKDTRGLLTKVASISMVMVAIGLAARLASRVNFKDMAVYSANALTIMAFALSIKTIIKAITGISNTDTKHIQDNMGSLLKVIALTAILTHAASKIKMTSGAGMIAVALSFKIIVSAFEELTKFNYEGILSSLSKYKLTIAMASVIIAKMAILLHEMGKNFMMFGAGLLLMTLSIKQIVRIGELLNNADVGAIVKGTVYVGAMMTLFAALTRLGKFSVEGKPQKLARMFIGMGVAITGLIGAVYLFGQMNVSTLTKGTIGVAGLMMALGASLRIMGDKLARVNFKTIMAVMAGIAILSGELVVISLLPFDQMMKGLFGLGAVMGMLSGTMVALGYLMKYSKGAKKSTAPMIALIGETLILTGALQILSEQPFDRLIAASTGLSSTLLAYGTTLLIMSKASKNSEGALKDTKTMLSGIGGLAIVTGAIVALSTFGKDSKSIITSAGAISMGMLAYAGSLAIVKSVANKTPEGSIFNTVLSGIAMTGIVTLAIGLLSRYGGSAENIIASAEAISIGLLAFAGVMVIIGATADLSKAAAKSAGYIIGAAATIGTAIGVMAAIIVIFGEIIGAAVNYFDPNGANLKAFGDAMAAIGDAFGSLIANLINKVGEASVRALTNILGELVRFVNALSELPPHDVDAATASLVALGRMAAHSDGLKDLDLKSLGSAFGEISSAFKSVKGTLAKNLTDEDFEMLTKVMGVLGELGKAAQELPAYGGFAQVFTGIKDYQAGIEAVGSLGSTVSTAVTELRKSKVDPSDIKIVGSVMSILGEFAKAAQELPKAYGLEQVIGGTQIYNDAINAIGDLATKISCSIEVIRTAKVSPEDLTLVENMVSVYGIIAKALAETEVSGGVVAWWEGDWTNSIPDVIGHIGSLAKALSSNIGKFKSAAIDNGMKLKIVNSIGIYSAIAQACAANTPSEDLKSRVTQFLAGIIGQDDNSKLCDFLSRVVPAFCESLASGVKNFDKVSESEVTKAVGAINAMASVLNAIANARVSGVDLESGWFNSDDFERVGDGLEKLAEPFKKFTKDVKGINIGPATQAFNVIGLIMSKMSGDSVGSVSDNLKKFGSNLKSFGKSYKSFAKNLTHIDTSSIRDLKSMLNTLKRTVKNFDTETIGKLKNLGTSIKNILKIDNKSLTGSFNSSLNGVLKQIKAFAPKFKGAGEKLVSKYISGIEFKKDDSTKAYNGVAKAGSKELAKHNKDYLSVGKSAVGSFSKGLKNESEIQKVIDAATRIGVKTKRALEKSLDINSPSKSLEKDGIFSLQGFARGLKNHVNLKKIRAAAENIGHTTDKGTRKSLDINSPSKVMEQDGHFAGLGFNNGLIGVLNETKTVGETLGKKGASSLFGGFTSTINKYFSQGKDLGSDLFKKGYNLIVSRFPSVGNFFDGLKKRLEGVVKNPLKMGKDFYQKSAKEITQGLEKSIGGSGVKFGDALNNAVAKGGAGGKGSKGAKGAGKGIGKALHNAVSKGLTDKQQIAKLLKNYFDMFVKLIPKYERLAKRNLSKSGYATIDYISRSFKNKDLRAAALYFSGGLADEINSNVADKLKKAGKKLNFKNYAKYVKIETKKVIKTVGRSFKDMKIWLDKIDPSKGLKKSILNMPSAVASWIKNYRPVIEYSKKAVKVLAKQYKAQGMSSDKANKKAKKSVQKLANYLFTSSGDYKKYVNDLDKQQKKLKKQESKAKRLRDVITNPKSTKKQIKAATKELEKLTGRTKKTREAINKDMAAIAKGSEKSLKAFKNNIKSAVNETLKFTDLDFSTGVNLLEHFMYSATKAEYFSGKLAHNLAAYSTTQITAYTTYKKEMEEMKKSSSLWMTYGNGWGKKFVEWLEKQGFEAADTVHMLAFASEKDVKEIIDNYATNVKNEGQVMADAYKERGKEVKHFTDNINKLSKMGFNPAIIAELIEKGVDGNPMTDVMLTWSKETIAEFNDEYKDYATLGENAANSLTASMSRALSKSVLSVSSLASKAGQSAANAYLNGFAGIMNSDSATTIIAKAVSKVTSVGKTDKTSGKSSKSTKKKTSGIEVVSRGVTKAYEEASKVGKVVVKNLKDNAAKAAMDSVDTAKQIISKSGILDPVVITPILDLTDLRRRANEMRTILDTSVSSALASQAVYATNTSAPSVQVTVKNDNKVFEELINTFDNGLNRTADAMSKVKVVMDTGVLVGQIAKPIDKSLGKVAKQKGRK